MQQLNATDAGFLYMETAETPMHVGGIYLYELPPGYPGDFYENFKAYIASRLYSFPVFTRKLAQLPFDIDAPLWVEDDDIDLDYHIRHLTLPKPGRFEDLEELAGQLHSNLLDRSRPLWQIYIIDGLADGRVVEFAKFHHAGFDGTAALSIIRQLYDTTPVPRPAPPPAPHHEKEEPDLLSLIGYVAASPLRQYLRTMQAIPDLLKVWTRLTLPDPDTLKLEPPSLPPLAPWTRLNGAITNERTCAMRTVPLKEIKRVAKEHSTTVNDVVLAMCSGALRRYLSETGDLPSESLTAFVPMSVREAGNAEMSIQTIGLLCSLASVIDDPVERLQAIHRSSQDAKRLSDIVKFTLFGFSASVGTSTLLYALMNMLGRYRLAENVRPLANLTISNMFGPPVPLYMVGAKLIAHYPLSIVTHGSALNITVMSYGDNLDIGLTGCRRILPDLRKLADYLVAALEELKADSLEAAAKREAAAAGTTPTRGKKKRHPAAGKSRRAKHARSGAKRTPHAPPSPETPVAPPETKSASAPPPPENPAHAPEESTRKFPYVVPKSDASAGTGPPARTDRDAAARDNPPPGKSNASPKAVGPTTRR